MTLTDPAIRRDDLEAFDRFNQPAPLGLFATPRDDRLLSVPETFENPVIPTVWHRPRYSEQPWQECKRVSFEHTIKEIARGGGSLHFRYVNEDLSLEFTAQIARLVEKGKVELMVDKIEVNPHRDGSTWHLNEPLACTVSSLGIPQEVLDFLKRKYIG